MTREGTHSIYTIFYLLWNTTLHLLVDSKVVYDIYVKIKKLNVILKVKKSILF